jgi:hypothetical protein
MVMGAGCLSLVLAASAQRCGPGERVLSLNSAADKFFFVASGQREPSLLHSATLESALALDLGLIPDIRQVFVERAEENLLVWIAIDNPIKEVREKVFQKQFSLIDGFPEVSFDFNLVSSKNRSAQEFASSAKLIYSREDT